MKKLLPAFKVCRRCGEVIRTRRRFHLRDAHQISLRPGDWTESKIREHFREPTKDERIKHGIKSPPQDQEAGIGYYLVTRSRVYWPHSYMDEEEFQRLVESNADGVFGEKCVYVPLKMRVETPRGARARVIDALFLDSNDPSNPGFYVVEYELRRHSNEHIVTSSERHL